MDKSNPIGKKFNKLTVLEFSHSDPLQHRMWKCKCDCGKEKILATRFLGRQISCGCIQHQGTYSGVGDIMGTLYSQMRAAAERRGISFTVSITRLWELFVEQDKKCAFTGLLLNFGKGKMGSNRTASLDRIDSSQDYTDGNVHWVHRRINVMKQDMTIEQFVFLCNLVSNKFKGMEMKETNPGIVDPQSASESLVIPAINYHKRKRPAPRRVSLKCKIATGKIPPITLEQENEIINMYKDNYTMRAIFAKTGINRSRISWVLKNHNIPTTSSWKGKRKNRSIPNSTSSL